ncbi:phosphomannomutase/phosphoglucomutase [Candidatus Woesearchaeota archaeon]|jgi:phosphomannomutase / phosphoglucomutase|nr:phosphomannomutase/phosphoglucomutase [Candidatus Woesearchaeota archaeon]MBT7062781.1 phosphomannomutase/phosphoglucomutase [Candidatus Woesearchaeota archaeon]MBT7402425.1 phosphomannomutase/phosphoglucomutase [Candidatus Woesearchaeota archaeon]
MAGIYKSYDIRGVYPSELNEETAENIGKAFGTINPGTIVVGGDSRLSTPSIKNKFILGLVSAGANVIDIGIVSTTMMIFATGFYKYDGGVMITGSHTPSNYNGIKFYTKGAVSIPYENGIDKIEALVQTKLFKLGQGIITKKDVFEDYKKFIIENSKFESDKRLKVVLDGSHGSSGKYYSNILRELGFDIVELFCEPDGRFPVHGPDPIKSLSQIKAKVVEEKADLGFIYDGDGDRWFVIKSDGELLDSNILFVLLTKQVLSKCDSGKIVHDVMCSRMISDAVEKYGGELEICRVGHTHIARMLSAVNGVFAGEVSGHYFFNETFNQDDVLLASIKLMEFLINNNTTIEEEILLIPEYFSEVSEANRATIKDSEKFRFIDNLKTKLKNEGHNVDDTDGVKIIFDDGWALFRTSNTEPKIGFAYESTTKEGLDRIKIFVDKIVETIPK